VRPAIVNTWALDADLVVLSGCETALGRATASEGYLGFTQALFARGARSVVLSLWEVNDRATSLLMARFYANLLGRRPELKKPMPKSDALNEAKNWLRNLGRADALAMTAELSASVERGKGANGRVPPTFSAATPAGSDNDRPYSHPNYWAAFILVGDPG
jgi:CHAT domain-containing protein